MQIQIQHVFGGKCGGGKPSDEQFVNHATALLPNGGSRGCGWVTGDNQPNAWSTCDEGHFRAIVKGAEGSTFWMGTHLNRRARKNCLYDCQIQESIVTTAS